MIAIIIITIIFAWAIYGMHVLDLHKPALEALSKPLAEWFAEPGNPVRALLWVGAIALSTASWVSPTDTLFNQMLPDFISISIAVIVIDELVGYRNRLERKYEIFEQIESPVRDVAVEALRLVRENGWLDEALAKISFRGVQWEEADLRDANLESADFWAANLKGTKFHFANLVGAKFQFSYLQGAIFYHANLVGADLQNARLQGSYLTSANLQGANLAEATLIDAKLKSARYNAQTKWPDGFNPKAAGAVEVRWDETKQDWIPVDETDNQP